MATTEKKILRVGAAVTMRNSRMLYLRVMCISKGRTTSGLAASKSRIGTRDMKDGNGNKSNRGVDDIHKMLKALEAIQGVLP